MSEPITFVGIDAHQRELQIAMFVGAATQPVQWTCSAEPSAIERLKRTLERAAPGVITCCYEAGPSGYTLQRRLTGGRVQCRVIAPSMIPQKPGDRVKTNRRDARKLAELFRAGLLTEVHPPTPAAEAVRDLCRARDDARQDLLRVRQRISKLLLRHGVTFTAGRHWTQRHHRWLEHVPWEHPAAQHVMRDYLLALAQVMARLTELDRALARIAEHPPYQPAVAALRCFRGVDTLTAVTLLAELHDIDRFPHPRALMAFVGLVPSERSTGDHQRRGAITKTGNRLARRLLIQAAWHYRHRPSLGLMARRRRENQPVAMLAIATKAEHRLCGRYRRLCAHGKLKPVAIAAVARELVGFVWAALHLPEARMM